MVEYWEGRFQQGGKIWGDQPSESAKIALKHFQTHGIQKILVLGAGYGRNTRLFSTHSLTVDGIEISPTAVQLAQSFDPGSTIWEGSFFTDQYASAPYDAIFAFNLFHLFLQLDREKFRDRCWTLLRPEGLLFLTVFSVEESSYHQGKEIEPDTFESKPGRPVHYFTKNSFLKEIHPFLSLESGLIEEPENHGKIGSHIHRLYYTLAKKKV